MSRFHPERISSWRLRFRARRNRTIAFETVRKMSGLQAWWTTASLAVASALMSFVGTSRPELLGVALHAQGRPAAAARETYADITGARIWFTDTGGSGIPVVLMH